MNNTYMKLSHMFSLFKKTTMIEKCFLIITFMVIAIVLANFISPSVEGFESNKKREFTTKTNSDVFDEFYVNVYDDLLKCDIKNNFEIGQIIQSTNISTQNKVLDIGSGTGHHVAILENQGYDTIGIDISPAMIKKAKDNYPTLQFIQNDALNSMNYNPNTFGLITCLYFTIYYMKNKRQFFDNCMKWLMPGGYLAVHLVDKENFDPIIPAGDPLTIISAQNYASKRITNTVVDFDTHKYKANFDLKDKSNHAVLHETFEDKKTGNIRKNEHRLYMDTQKTILSQAKAAGFIFVAQIDLMKCQYENQYIYILKKPN